MAASSEGAPDIASSSLCRDRFATGAPEATVEGAEGKWRGSGSGASCLFRVLFLEAPVPKSKPTAASMPVPSATGEGATASSTVGWELEAEWITSGFVGGAGLEVEAAGAQGGNPLNWMSQGRHFGHSKNAIMCSGDRDASR